MPTEPKPVLPPTPEAMPQTPLHLRRIPPYQRVRIHTKLVPLPDSAGPMGTRPHQTRNNTPESSE
jgi:hypothetical protein